ncbi:MAG: aldo/keto reductase [Candidatus Bathyarchaeota archaeon]|nr:aldo/keto reductase [Candidatus Bathyarchaeota archaeon]
MEERILGKTNLKVKALGFGGIPIQRVSEEEAIEVVRRCYDLGINYFDTARLYSVSEDRIGKALEDVREKVFIATKSICRTESEFLQELDISLKDLRTEWIDVYQLHNVASKEDWIKISSRGGALEAAYKALDRGKIKHLGITSHNSSILTEIVKKDIFEVIQIPYNYLSLMAKEELLPLCNKKNVGTVIMKPMAGGEFSRADVALKFILKDENVDVVIPGMMSVVEVEENVAITSHPYDLSADDLKLIEEDKNRLGTQFCRGCDYCQPCPQEIPISNILRVESFVKRLKGTDKLKELVKGSKEKVDSCIDCGECESRCPYHLPIREMFHEKIEYIDRNIK